MGRIKHFERISSSREFDFVYKKADSTWHTPYFVLFFKNTQYHKVAFVASKKVGNAVARNRAKRLLRASFVSRADDLKDGHYILVAKPAILETPYVKISSEYSKILKRLKLLL